MGMVKSPTKVGVAEPPAVAPPSSSNLPCPTGTADQHSVTVTPTAGVARQQPISSEINWTAAADGCHQQLHAPPPSLPGHTPQPVGPSFPLTPSHASLTSSTTTHPLLSHPHNSHLSQFRPVTITQPPLDSTTQTASNSQTVTPLAVTNSNGTTLTNQQLAALPSNLPPHPLTPSPHPTITFPSPLPASNAVTSPRSPSQVSSFPTITIPSSTLPSPPGNEATPTSFLPPSLSTLSPGTQLTLVPVLQDSHIILYGVPDYVIQEIRRSKVSEAEQMQAIINFAVSTAVREGKPISMADVQSSKVNSSRGTLPRLQNGQTSVSHNSAVAAPGTAHSQSASQKPANSQNAQSHSQTVQPNIQFPNAEAIKTYRIPKRKAEGLLGPQPKRRNAHIPPRKIETPRKPKGKIRNPPKPLVSSDPLLKDSVVMERYRSHLPSNPHTLTFTITSSQGHKWTNTSLEGLSSLSPSPSHSCLTSLPPSLPELWLAVVSDLQEQRYKLDMPYTPCTGEWWRVRV